MYTGNSKGKRGRRLNCGWRIEDKGEATNEVVGVGEESTLKIKLMSKVELPRNWDDRGTGSGNTCVG